MLAHVEVRIQIPGLLQVTTGLRGIVLGIAPAMHRTAPPLHVRHQQRTLHAFSQGFGLIEMIVGGIPFSDQAWQPRKWSVDGPCVLLKRCLRRLDPMVPSGF